MSLRFIFSSLLVLLVAGCASGGGGHVAVSPSSMQSVRVSTPGVMGASCVLQMPTGSYVLLSPARIDVPRSSGPLTVSCNKGEHFRGKTTVKSSRVVENGADIYSYPASVSVPMTLHNPSLKPKYRVIGDG